MSAAEIHPDYQRIVRLLDRRFSPTLTPARIQAGRSFERRSTLRIRHRGTSLEVVRSPVEMRVIRPRGQQHPTPALLLIHGGGYVLGRARMDDRVASAIAKQLGITVVSVEYRRAPEDPYPASLNDCYAALLWLHAQPWVKGDRIAVAGASAGGGLAAALAQHAHDKGEVPIACQVLVYPMLDDRTALRTDIRAVDHVIWNAENNRAAWRFYLGQEPGIADVPTDAAPARRLDLQGLPPAWIGVGTADIFHDECVDYARRLRAAGVPCEVAVVEGGVHGFERIAPRKRPSRDFAQAQINALRAALYG